MTKAEINKEINRLITQLTTVYKPEKIILFGSVLTGKVSPDSDIDLLIIKRNVPHRGIDRIQEVDRILERRGIAIDILVYKPEEIKAALDDGDPFISYIIKKGKVVYDQ
ncbi:nucleotidyltransferase domain-containing protein [bacterium]|nr:nucleotidyltransferase domain-containing protein [bacterium]